MKSKGVMDMEHINVAMRGFLTGIFVTAVIWAGASFYGRKAAVVESKLRESENMALSTKAVINLQKYERRQLGRGHVYLDATGG